MQLNLIKTKKCETCIYITALCNQVAFDTELSFAKLYFQAVSVRKEHLMLIVNSPMSGNEWIRSTELPSLYVNEDSLEQQIVPDMFLFFIFYIYSQLPPAAQFIFHCSLPAIRGEKKQKKRITVQENVHREHQDESNAAFLQESFWNRNEFVKTNKTIICCTWDAMQNQWGK